ncbi:MAG TPA: hypothetical protein VLL05_21550 [Terriglobales bacterium]|nr:hypothetical protein [Terriglobales bacterium]
MHLLLQYFDQNDAFANLLPRAGTIEKTILSQDGSEWVLFRLEAPFSYEGSRYEYLLLKSRWHDLKIGAEEPTSVFILVVASSEQVKDGFNVHEFPQVLGVWYQPCGE